MINIKRFLTVCFLSILLSCTSQARYVGDVYILNVCITPITVTSYNDTGRYLDFIGQRGIVLMPGEKRAWLTFNMSNVYVRSDVSNFFIDNGQDNFRVNFSNGYREKTFTARQVILLLKDVTTQEDQQRGRMVYEIRNNSMCPD